MRLRLILIIVGLSCALSAMAQEHIEKRYSLFFRANESRIDQAYMDNGHTIQTMIDDIKTTLDVVGNIPDSLLIYASTSPEGSLQLNERLAIQRAENTKTLLTELFPQFDPANIKVESRINDWSGLILTLRRDSVIKHKEALLKVLTDSRIQDKTAALRAIPQAYAEIRDGIFNTMRTATITISVIGKKDEFTVEPELIITSDNSMNFPSGGGKGRISFSKNVENDVIPAVSSGSDWIKNLIPADDGVDFEVAPNTATEPRTAPVTLEYFGKTYEFEVSQAAAEPVVEVIPETIEEPATDVPEEAPVQKKERKFYMAAKTNMLYDLALIPNIGAEFYLGKNFSIAGNWMYSWWKSDKKHWYWRTFGGDLAVRYWLGKAAKEKPLTGHHLGLYGQLLTYDVEFGKKGILADDFNWTAGLEYGYSLPIASRLNIDFTLGVGYHWGIFEEYLPIDGHYAWQATKKRQYVGPTKLEVSLVWLIGKDNINKGKGGKR